MFLDKTQVLKFLFVVILHFEFVLTLPTANSQKKQNAIQNTIDQLYSKLIDEEYRNMSNTAPRILPIETDREIINFYDTDVTPINSSICGNHSLSFEPPFPAFVAPFMTLLASQYTEWRSRIPQELSCAVAELTSVDSHPCPHENSSCVIISLPNNHVFFGCMNDQTGDLVAPKNWDILKGNTDSDKFLIDFRVPSPFKIDRPCNTDATGKPICQRVNIFHNDNLIVEENACCCKGDFCADVLFDQHGFNPVPFIHVESDETNRIAPPEITVTGSAANSKPKKLSLQDPQVAENGGFGWDWDFSPIETIVVICVVIIIIIIVISVGLWFVYEKEKEAELAKHEAIVRDTAVFSIYDKNDAPFNHIEKNGKRIN